MTRRFFIDGGLTGSTGTIAAAEAHHLLHVMRARLGDVVVLFDGSGREFEGEITTLGCATVTVRIIAERVVDRELPFQLTLGVALPKGDRQRWLVEKLVELGVTELVPLVTSHSVAQPSESTLHRLRRGVVEASKQCGRNRLMTVATARVLDDFLGDPWTGRSRLLLHPTRPIPTWTGAPSEPKGEETLPVVAAVGPEGGFSPAEVSRAEQLGWRVLGLGPRILRTETAAVALAAHLALSRMP